MAAKDFFDSLPGRADASKLAGMTNSVPLLYRGRGQWRVVVQDGKLEVSDGGGDAGADATITTSSDVFAQIVAGEQIPTTGI